MSSSHSKANRPGKLRASFSFCVLLGAVAAAVFAAPCPGLAAPEIAVFTGNTTEVAASRTNGLGEYAFAATALGQSRTETFTIQNKGDTALSGLALSLTGQHLSVYVVSALTSTTLAPNAVATFSVTFNPMDVATLTGTLLSIANNDADENPFRIRLGGIGTPMEITQQPVDTRACVGSTAQFFCDAGPVATYRWQRKLPGDSIFQDITTGATSSSYVTPPVVAANHGTVYRARVSRNAATLFSSEAQLSVIDNTIPSPTVVYNFNDGNLNGAAIYGQATVVNGALELNRLEEGSLGALLTPDLAPTRVVSAFSANFKVRMSPGNGYADGFSFNWATDLPQGAYFLAEEGVGNGLSVCFDTYEWDLNLHAVIRLKWNGNTAAQYRTDNFFLPGDANDFADVAIRLHNDGTVDVYYRCTPIFLREPVPGYTPLLNSRFGLGSRTGGIFETHTIDDLAIEVFAPEIAVTGNGINIAAGDSTPSSADSTDFGGLGTRDFRVRTFTITNEGNLPLTVGTVEVSGPHASDFTVTTMPAAQVGPRGSTTFSIGLDPGGVGLRSARVSFNNGDASENPFQFNIQGTGVAAPEIVVFNGNTTDVAAARTNGIGDYVFAPTAIGYGSTSVFTIQNIGESPLSGLALELSGSHVLDYKLSALTATELAPNATGTFSVSFEPGTQGVRDAALLSIHSNDGDESPFRIGLSGTSLPMQISRQPADASTCVGGSVTFECDGGPVASYQWQKKAPGASAFQDIPLNLPGATSPTYQTPPAAAAHDGTVYRARVAEGSTILYTREAVLSVVDNVMAAPTVIYDFNSAGPAGTTLLGHATIGNDVLELNRLEQNSSGAFLTPDLTPTRTVRAFAANFKVRMVSGSGHAEGFSFNWASDLNGALFAGEEGAGTGLSVCFDTLASGGPGNEAAVRVKWGGEIVATKYFANDFLPGGDNGFADVTIRLNRNGTVDIGYRCTVVFARLLLPDFQPQSNSRFALSARTGASYETHAIEDLAIEVDSTATFADATVPGDPVTPTSGHSPETQGATNAIDNNVMNKYLNFDKLDTGLTISPFTDRPVRGITLVSAEDAPERDPSSFILDGSHDGTNFTRIASNAVPAFPSRHFVQSFTVANTNVFRHYRLLFPTVSNSVTANSMQIGEVELLYHEEITSSEDTVSLELPPGARDFDTVGFLFDRSVGSGNRFVVIDVTNETIVHVTLAAGAKVLKAFELMGSLIDLEFPLSRPSRISIAGSNDKLNYTSLGTVIPAEPAFNFQIQEFAISSNNAAFAHYRITFGPPVGEESFQIGELRFFGESATAMPATLSLSVVGENVLIQWPENPGFTLEAKSSLSGGAWEPVGIFPALNNGVNTVTLPKNRDASFFRLRK